MAIPKRKHRKIPGYSLANYKYKNDGFTVEGLEDLEAALLKLEKKVATKALKAALSKSGRPILAAAKAKVKIVSGGLRASLGQRTVAGKYANFASLYVGTTRSESKKAVELANVGRSKKIRGVWYGHIVELGYGRQAPQPFLRPALESTQRQAVEIFARELKKGIDSVAGK